MKKTKTTIGATAAFFLLGALLLTACGGRDSGAPLVGTEWELVAYRKTKPLPNTSFTIKFEADQVSGNGGCNSYFGPYAIDGDKITIGPLGSTMMACPEPEGLMDQEQYLLGFLGAAQRYELAEGTLIIHRADRETLTFVPK